MTYPRDGFIETLNSSSINNLLQDGYRMTYPRDGFIDTLNSSSINNLLQLTLKTEGKSVVSRVFPLGITLGYFP